MLIYTNSSSVKYAHTYAVWDSVLGGFLIISVFNHLSSIKLWLIVADDSVTRLFFGLFWKSYSSSIIINFGLFCVCYYWSVLSLFANSLVWIFNQRRVQNVAIWWPKAAFPQEQQEFCCFERYIWFSAKKYKNFEDLNKYYNYS